MPLNDGPIRAILPGYSDITGAGLLVAAFFPRVYAHRLRDSAFSLGNTGLDI